MGQIRIVTSDEVLLNSAQAAVGALDGWDFAGAAAVDDLVAGAGERGDVIGGGSGDRVRDPAGQRVARRLLLHRMARRLQQGVGLGLA